MVMKTITDNAASIRTIMMKRWMTNFATLVSSLASGTWLVEKILPARRKPHCIRLTRIPASAYIARALSNRGRMRAYYTGAGAYKRQHLLEQNTQRTLFSYCASLK